MRISTSLAQMEALQNNQRVEHAQGDRVRIEQLEQVRKERSTNPRYELQEVKDKQLERPRGDTSVIHRTRQSDQPNFHRFKDIDQLPTRQRLAVMTYSDNQHSADIAVTGELLSNVDYYA